MRRALLSVSSVAMLTAAGCGNSGTSGGGGAGGSVTDCKMLSASACFSDLDCATASDRCQNKGTADTPVACCVPGARGAGKPGASCKTEDDCTTTCVDDGTGALYCSAACAMDSDCPSVLPSCVDPGSGFASLCGSG